MEAGFTKAIKYWVPSIAMRTTSKWNGDALTSLKDQSLRKIKFKNDKLLDEKVIFKKTIEHRNSKSTGKIFF